MSFFKIAYRERDLERKTVSYAPARKGRVEEEEGALKESCLQKGRRQEKEGIAFKRLVPR